MTRREQLAELIAKVETGGLVQPFLFQDVFNNQDTHKNCAGEAYIAYEGSLDAAKALHEAVLPGCSQYSIVTDPTCLCVKVCWWPDGLSGVNEIHGEGWSEDGPARAWLLAILRALHAQEPETP